MSVGLAALKGVPSRHALIATGCAGAGLRSLLGTSYGFLLSRRINDLDARPAWSGRLVLQPFRVDAGLAKLRLHAVGPGQVGGADGNEQSAGLLQLAGA